MQLILRHRYSWGRRVLGPLISVTRSHWLVKCGLGTALRVARPHGTGTKPARYKSGHERLSDRIPRLPSRMRITVNMDTKLDIFVDMFMDKIVTICYMVSTYNGHKCGHMRRHILG